jgi:hypothetical protein
MKIKKTKASIFERQGNGIYDKAMTFVYSIKHYLFIYMCSYFLISISLYYLKLPSYINTFFELIALIILVSVATSTFYSIQNLRGSDELKNQLSLDSHTNVLKKEMTNNYYKEMRTIHKERTIFDKYWYYAAVAPIVAILALGWFDTLFVLYLVSIALNKHFLDSELESMEILQDVIQKPKL